MTNANNCNIDLSTARAIALRETGLGGARFESDSLDGGCWELSFSSQEMHYDCYVDAVSGEVLGLDFYPVPVERYPAYAKPWRMKRARSRAA